MASEVAMRPNNEPAWWNIPVRFTFQWLDKIVFTGRRRQLTEDDLYELKPEFLSADSATKLEARLAKTKGPARLHRAILTSFCIPFLFAGFFKLVHDICMFIAPMMIPTWVSYIEELQADKSWSRVWVGLLLALVLLLNYIIQSFCLNQYFFIVQRTGLKVRTALSHAVYRKTTRVSESIRQRSSTGKLVNLLFTDTQRIQTVFNFMHLIWSSPFQIIVALTLLSYSIGPAGLAGVAVMILMIPVNSKLGKVMITFRRRILNVTDERVRQMGEGLNGMRILKMTAWELRYADRVKRTRMKEVGWLLRIAVLQSVIWFISWSSPILVTVATFIVFAMIPGNELTTSSAFVTLNLLKSMQFSVQFIPTLISMLATAQVSMKRIYGYLDLPEVSSKVTEDPEDPNAITVQGGPSFSFEAENEGEKIDSLIADMEKKRRTLKDRLLRRNKERQKHASGTATPSRKATSTILHDINIAVPRGQMTAITGSVGSGKSALLSAVLGEMRLIPGETGPVVNVNGMVAFASQSAWIANKTLRENILFDRPYDKELYRKVIWASCLADDISQFESGDQVEIGEKGINLSGGQKQRVAIARALYSIQDRDIFIFDDPLAAVDAHVAKRLFARAFKTLLKGKTVILVTHQEQYVPRCDHLVHMAQGRVVESSPVARLREEGRLGQFVSVKTDADDDVIVTPEDIDLDADYMQTDMHDESAAAAQAKGKLMTVETSETGAVSVRIILKYLMSMGGVGALLLTVLVYGLGQASNLSIDLVLSYWSSASQDYFWYCLAGYVGAALFAILCIFLRNIVTSMLTLRASYKLHSKMLDSVMRAPMSLFEVTPTGRILNRFSKDVDALDSSMPNSWASLMAMVSGVVVNFITLVVLNFFFIIPLVPILIVYVAILQLFRASARMLKRMDSTTRSPVFAQFEETLAGLTTIRAFKVSDRFVHNNAEAVDRNNRALYTQTILLRWLALRLEILGSFIVFFVAMCGSIIAPLDIVAASLFALSLTISLNMTQSLAWLVRQTTEVEVGLNAVERVVEYSKLPQEKALTNYVTKELKASQWPQTGSIVFKDLKVRYRPELPVVLSIADLTIADGQKVGVVGRTGSGKSTLFNVLFRIIEADEGSSVTVDNRCIQDLGLHDVRHALAIIPQDPVLFNATLRYNLDPYDEFTDEQIWEKLELVKIRGVIEAMADGEPTLSVPVREAGGNFSQGQRQLLCIARALLRDARIICLDEATASVDLETDRFIQSMIREQFKDKTVLTVAHRLNTVIDSDMVLVLDQGAVAEYGPPKTLAEHGGEFARLVEESGQAAELFAQLGVGSAKED
ncbi:ABC transporter transmembrane region [Carpediemonas membranifera]|uniref:ABC transporter transmembrane region n=1 Tax=Carpediemonas membranifera TaxID=201153 RepID=A0A8J6ATM0_9EUKA|nr:ABC transporter transmembrane region [Carpediemonas membranifera]|eukprot:KAG9391170.1 ABC transporter transmembrane region [Carpediemonas membranifera]